MGKNMFEVATRTKNMFEVATRTKMRFPFKGMISVEDLWDLSVQNLDKVFKTLNSQRKEAQEESLLNVKSSEDEVLDTQIAIVKYIVGVKLEEQAARVKAAENKEKKQKIMALMAKKDDEEMENMSREELQKLLDELE